MQLCQELVLQKLVPGLNEVKIVTLRIGVQIDVMHTLVGLKMKVGVEMKARLRLALTALTIIRTAVHGWYNPSRVCCMPVWTFAHLEEDVCP